MRFQMRKRQEEQAVGCRNDTSAKESKTTNRAMLGDVDAWMKANADSRAWNACAIVKGQKYVYFKRLLRRIPIKREVNKEDW